MSPEEKSKGRDLGEDFRSPKEMRLWAQQELLDIAKAAELRRLEVTELVTAYESGKLTPQEADDRYSRYQHRWDEALPGINVSETVTDEQILAAIDATRDPYLSTGTIREKYEKLHGKGRRGRKPAR